MSEHDCPIGRKAAIVKVLASQCEQGICRICGGASRKEFTAQVLRKYSVKYFLCATCGAVTTEDPYWLDEAYTDAVATADTGLVSRNVALSKCITSLLVCLFNRDARFLDISGGTGLFTRLMRDNGFDYYWFDPYCKNVHARGFEKCSQVDDFRVVTAFEVLEHLQDPITFISQALQSERTVALVFTTELFEAPPPRIKDWDYYVPETGQHICFYQRATLQYIANSLDVHFYSSCGIHMFSKQAVSGFIFALSVGRAGRLAAPLFKKFLLRSKTLSDHKLVIGSGVVRNSP